MNRKSINSEDKKINKSVFYKNKKLFYIHDIDVNKKLDIMMNIMYKASSNDWIC